MTADPRAIAEYVNSLRPSARLKYYQLTKGERLTLDAMLNCTKGTGENVFASMEKLAELAGVDVRTVRNSINGYKRKNGTRHQGLLSRKILVQTKRPNHGVRRTATYRINFAGFTLNPRQLPALERRLQQPGLPGMDLHNGPQPSTGFPPKCPATASGQTGNSCRPERKKLPGRAATASPVVEKLVVGSSPSQSSNSSSDGDSEIREIITRSFRTSVCYQEGDS